MLWVLIIDKMNYFTFLGNAKSCSKGDFTALAAGNDTLITSLRANVLIDHLLEIHEWNSSLGPSAMEIYVSYAAMQSVYLFL